MNESEANPKILIVDDKPQNLYALEKTLKELGAVEVIQATTGTEALRLTLGHDFFFQDRDTGAAFPPG